MNDPILEKVLDQIQKLCAKAQLDEKTVGYKLVGRAQKKIRSPERQKVVTLYEKGLSPKQISEHITKELRADWNKRPHKQSWNCPPAYSVGSVNRHLRLEGLIPPAPRNVDITKRNEEIWKLRQLGETFVKIASIYGLSRGHVQSICSTRAYFERRMKGCPTDANINSDTTLEAVEPKLSTRLANCLKNMAWEFPYVDKTMPTLGQLAAIPEHKLLRYPNLGRKSVHEWQEFLLKHNLPK